MGWGVEGDDGWVDGDAGCGVRGAGGGRGGLE